MRCKAVLCLLIALCSGLATSQINVDFNANIREGCGSLQTRFEDLSSSDDGAIVEWMWELDEGLVSEVASPGRVFTEPGVYDICLTVTDVSGNTSRRCKAGFIVVYDLPRVEFTASTVSGCAPLDVTFESLTTSDNPVSRMIWDLGGEAGVRIGGQELEKVTASYQEAQVYGVSLTVEDEKGCISSLAKSGLIRVGALSRPDITVVDPLGCDAPHGTAIEVNSLDATVLYTWDFGNNMQYSGKQPPPQLFSDQGTYTLTVFARDTTSNCRDTFYYENYVNVGLTSAPEVNFDSGCVGSVFRFSDPTIRGGETVIWDFGDGQTSTKPLPNHVYDSAGCYTVSIAKSYSGCDNFSVLETCIEVVNRPVIQLATDKWATCQVPGSISLEIGSPQMTNTKWIIGNSNEQVNGQFVEVSSDQDQTIPFSVSGTYLPGCILTYEDSVYFGPMEIDLLTLPPAGCVTASARMRPVQTNGFDLSAWEWTVFTDPPQSSGEERPTFNIDQPGTYDVSLIGRTDDGCIDSVKVKNYVAAGTPPEVSISSNITSTCADTAVQFTADFSTPVSEVFWDFGDGGESDEFNPSHSFLDTGEFTVVLYASYNGCVSIDSLSNVIDIRGPVARFGSRVICGTLDLELRDASIAADDVRYEVTQNGLVILASNIPDVTLTLPMVGEYEVIQYTANQNNGCEDEHRDSVFAGPIDVQVAATPLSGCTPLEVQFTSEARHVDNWKWSIPGGLIANDTFADPTVVFHDAGKYSDVLLTVTDKYGCITQVEPAVNILVGAAEPNLGDTTYIGCTGSEIQLLLIDTPTVPVVSWNWTIEPGATTSNDEKPKFSSPTPGFYHVGLDIVDSLGCTNTTSSDSLIHIIEDHLDFIGDTVTCANVRSVFRIADPFDGLVYRWYLTDSMMYTGDVWKYTFDSIGAYEVCVTVEGVEGCDSSICKTVVVAHPEASFEVDTNYSSCPPLLVNFLNTSEYATSFEWYFGDNSGRTALDSPLHVYTEPGIYDVTLIAMLSDNCSDTLLARELIELEGPVGDFEYSFQDECLPVQVEFEGFSVDPYDYVWDFGNGVLDSTETRVLSDSTSFTYINRGTYVPRLILIDTLNCRRALSGEDTIYVRGEFLEAGPDLEICAGESIELLPEVLAGSVSWQAHPMIPDTNQLTLSLAPDSTTVFVIRGYEGSCFEEDSIRVHVEREVMIESNNVQICMGDTARIDVSGDAEVYEWHNAEGIPLQYGVEQSITLSPDTTTVLTVIGYRSICVPDTITTTVDVYGNFDYDLPDKAIVYKGENYRIPMRTEQSDIEITWNPAAFVDCESCPDPVVLADSSMTFYVSLTEPVLGCTTTDSITLRFPARCTGDFAFLPNVFSPNGDGVNDHVKLESTKYKSPIEFSVYDRWGNRVYNADSIDFEWNGTNGSDFLNPGVYVYRLQLTCPIDDSPVVVTGDITIVR